MKTLLLLTLVVGLASITVAGVPPSSINYQGKLYDISGNPIEGTINVELNLYTNDTLSDVVYHESVGDLEVVGGVYSFSYGTNETLFLKALSHDEVWLEVVIDNEPLIPKQRLISVPYALYSRKSVTPGDGRLIFTDDHVTECTYVNTEWGGPTWYGIYIPEGTTELRAQMQAKFVNGGEYRLCCHGNVGPTFSSEPTPTSPYPFTQEMTVPVLTSGWCNISVQVRNYAVPGGTTIYKIRVYSKED